MNMPDRPLSSDEMADVVMTLVKEGLEREGARTVDVDRYGSGNIRLWLSSHERYEIKVTRKR